MMSMFDRLQSTQVSPKTAGISILVLLILCGFGVFGARKLASGSSEASAGTPPAASSAGSVAQASVDVNANSAPADRAQAKGGEAAPAVDDPCKVIAERDIFKPVSANSTDSGGGFGFGRRSSGGRIPPFALDGLPVLPGMPGVDMALLSRHSGEGAGTNLAYTGLVDVPGGPLALIENITTSEAKYVGVGDSAFGMRVLSVSPRSVSLDSDGRSVRLAIGENKPETTTASSAASAQRGLPQQSTAAQQLAAAQAAQLAQPALQPNPMGMYGASSPRLGFGRRGMRSGGSNQGQNSSQRQRRTN